MLCDRVVTYKVLCGSRADEREVELTPALFAVTPSRRVVLFVDPSGDTTSCRAIESLGAEVMLGV